jgi:hypothetical protein
MKNLEAGLGRFDEICWGFFFFFLKQKVEFGELAKFNLG